MHEINLNFVSTFAIVLGCVLIVVCLIVVYCCFISICIDVRNRSSGSGRKKLVELTSVTIVSEAVVANEATSILKKVTID